ncbi:MAG: hypothetical protein JST16_16505 [Bdellovibrionales bacterium]|nr:hypothetical protein [Bdellovibrionales bacterium]
MRRELGLAAAVLLGLSGCGGGEKSASAPGAAEKKAAVTYFRPDPATAGKISGKISFTGKKPNLRKIDMEAEADCMKVQKTAPTDPSVIVNDNGTLRNVFVYIKSGLEGKNFEPVKAPVKFDQHGCMFIPRVLGIMTDQPIEITNSDSVSHNVHPLARNNREWNQSQPPGAPKLEREFAKPEIMMQVKCNVHPWMKSYIGVVAHPYFSVSDEQGSFEVKDLPPGEYVIEAWHERYPPQQQKVTLGPAGSLTADFTFKGE